MSNFAYLHLLFILFVLLTAINCYYTILSYRKIAKGHKIRMAAIDNYHRTQMEEITANHNKRLRVILGIDNEPLEEEIRDLN